MADFVVPGPGLAAIVEERSRPGRLALAVTAATLLMIAVQVSLVVLGNAPVVDGILTDPDAYMRLSRVELLWAGGDWYDPVFPRIDPPAGFTLHWTRPMDALLLAGAWLASPFLGFEGALYWWGVLVSPVLHVISLIAFVWAAAPLLHRQWLSWSAFLFVSQPAIFVSFLVGRPDHHGLLALLSILVIGFAIRVLCDPERTRDAVWLGLVSALALWVSIESLLIVAISIGALGMFWLAGERRYAGVLTLNASTLLAALAAALFAERGAAGILAFDIDRLSSAHLTLFAINLAFWAGVDYYDRRGVLSRSLLSRIGWTVLGLAAALATVSLLQPGFFADPLSSGDELYTAKHLAHIEELQPLFGRVGSGEGSWSVARPILWLGIAVLAVPWLVYSIVNSKGPERRVWVYLGIGALVVLPVAAAQRRWSIYPEIFLLMPYAAFAGTVLDRLAAGLSRKAAGLGRLSVICAMCVWFYVPAAISDPDATPQSPAGVAEACPINALAPVLNDPAGLGASPKRVLAFIDVGPELLYRTPHSVFSIPNHRIQPGFTTTYRIMTATDVSLARELLEESRVDLIIVCPESAESWFYDTKAPGPTLHRMLSEGRAPDFLDPIALPAKIAGRVGLFAVRRGG